MNFILMMSRITSFKENNEFNMIYTEDQIYPFFAPDDSHGFLSNWYKSDFRGVARFSGYDEYKIANVTEYCYPITYVCAEQFLMASKATLFGDLAAHEKIMLTNSPREMKDFGRRVKNFNSAVWDANKMSIMRMGLYYKFTQNEKLQRGLLLTGDKVLIEASPYDHIWGVGLGPNDARLLNTDEWRGQNLLGQCLIDIRKAIQNGSKS